MTDRGLTALNAVLDFSKQQIAFAGILTSITFAFFSSRPFSESAFRDPIPVTMFVSWVLFVLCFIFLVLIVVGRSGSHSENGDRLIVVGRAGSRSENGDREQNFRNRLIREISLLFSLIVCFALGVILRFFPCWFFTSECKISIFTTTSVSWGFLFLSVLLGLLGVLGQAARRLQEKEKPEQIVMNRWMTACGLLQIICLVLGVSLLFFSVSTLVRQSTTQDIDPMQKCATVGVTSAV